MAEEEEDREGLLGPWREGLSHPGTLGSASRVWQSLGPASLFLEMGT